MEKMQKLEEFFNALDNLPEQEKEKMKEKYEEVFIGAINSIPENELAPIQDRNFMITNLDVFAKIIKGKADIKEMFYTVSLLTDRNRLIEIATICRKILPSLL